MKSQKSFLTIAEYNAYRMGFKEGADAQLHAYYQSL